jgi:hypothetical protein
VASSVTPEKANQSMGNPIISGTPTPFSDESGLVCNVGSSAAVPGRASGCHDPDGRPHPRADAPTSAVRSLLAGSGHGHGHGQGLGLRGARGQEERRRGRSALHAPAYPYCSLANALLSPSSSAIVNLNISHSKT